jgi:plasmid stabilization system protein ParE
VTRPVFIRPAAERDMERARTWYEDVQSGLGDRLIDEAYAAVSLLREEADRFSIYYRELRRINLPTFPYKFFFKIEREYVTVLRLLHAKQDHPRHLRR